MATPSPRRTATVDSVAAAVNRATSSRCIPCPWCSVIALRSHQLRCPRRTTECPDCGASMSCAALQAHKGGDACPGATVNCAGCGAGMRRSELKRHLQHSCQATAFACPSCSRVFNSAEDFAYHAVPTCIERQVVCQLCNVTMPAIGLASHLVTCAALAVRRGTPPPPRRVPSPATRSNRTPPRTGSPARTPQQQTPQQRSGSAGDSFGPWGSSSRGASAADVTSPAPQRQSSPPASKVPPHSGSLRGRTLLSSTPGKLAERSRALSSSPRQPTTSRTPPPRSPSTRSVGTPAPSSAPRPATPTSSPAGRSPTSTSKTGGVNATTTPRGRPLSASASRTPTNATQPLSATPTPKRVSSLSPTASSRSPASRTNSTVTRSATATSAMGRDNGSPVMHRLSSRWHALTSADTPPQPLDVVDVITGQRVKDLASFEQATLLLEWRRSQQSRRLVAREAVERLKMTDAQRNAPRALTTLVFTPPQKRKAALERT